MAERLLNLNMEEFKTLSMDTTESWLDCMRSRRSSAAAELCHQFIEKYRAGFRDRAFNIEGREYSIMLVVLIFVRGLFDCAHLCWLVDNRLDWDKNHELLESVWIRMCDVRDRLTFSYPYCRCRAIEWALCSLARLEEYYFTRFGAGSYVSPGIESDGCLCSICSKDIRACDHVPGRLYNGTFCSAEPIDPSPTHVALVDSPADRRCRIWPWNIENTQDNSGLNLSVMVMCSFSIDGFLFEERA